MNDTPLPRASVPDSQPLLAAIWMIGAIVSFTAMAVAARNLSEDFDTFEIMTYRSLLGVLVVLGVGAWAGTLHQINTRQIPLHLTRNLCHFAGQNLWLFAITLAPLAQVFAIEFSSPLWATLLAPLVLGERLTRTRVLTGLVGFAGILLVTRPDSTTLLNPGLVAAALAAVGFAGSALFTRLLTRTQTITCILFYLTLMQAVFGLICTVYDGVIAVPAGMQWVWMAVVGLSGLTAHFCLTTALSIAPAAIVMPIDFARLPIIALVGMVLFDEPLEAAVFIGAILIFGANYANIRVETRRRPE